MSRTITEESVDLEKFLTSRVRQLAKMFESSKASAHHIKQVAGDQQVAQINLMWHQQTELQNNRHNKRKRPVSKQRHHKAPKNQVTGQVKKIVSIRLWTKTKTNVISVTIQFMHRDFNALLRNTNAKCVTNMVIFQVCYQKKTQAHHKSS